MILFLMTRKQLATPDESTVFISLLAAEGVEIEIGCYDDISAFVSMKERRIWIGTKDLREYQAVYFRSLSGSARSVAALCALYLKEHDVPFVDSEAAASQSFSKLQQMYLLAQHAIAIPATFHGKKQHLDRLLADRTLQFPLIVKGNVASRGRDNYLVQSEAELQEVLQKKPSGFFIVQEAIPNQGDYRVLVLGGEARWAMYRQRMNNETHLNNTSQGAMGTVVSLDDSPLATVRPDLERAAKLLGRDIAGVDVLFHQETGAYAILEVNRTPQLSNGAQVDQKIAALAAYLKSLQKVDDGSAGH
ncbi:MAG TPA: hypothetical protein VLF60_00215 [Candidatus Saccharimonadales bacterium]|nr:hypothetical protein [Candidatus Saccharimonadales bacterium]